MVNMYHSSKSTDKVPLKTFTNSRCQQQRVDVTKHAKRTPTHKKSQKDLQE